MTGVRHLEVTEDEAGLRLDRWFKSHFPQLGHGRLAKMLRTGQIRLDGRRAKAGDRVAAGQSVRIPPLDSPADSPAPASRNIQSGFSDKDIKLLENNIIYQDKDVLVLNKPSGLATQGGSKTTRHLDGLLAAWAQAQRPPQARPKLVHRLDRDTSGVLVAARTDLAARRLTAAFRGGTAEKTYWAVTRGVPAPAEGRVHDRLAKRRIGGQEKMVADETGKMAETLYRVLARVARRAALVEFRPLTGRTHQIRAHALALGTPILGDARYSDRDLDAPLLQRGGEALARPRLHLHARRLVISHPRGGMIDITAPLPPHMTDTCAFLGLDANLAEAGV
ncbi:MAG: RluA family pseudouridine synthase [Alphaproteobacteria bacterium]